MKSVKRVFRDETGVVAITVAVAILVIFGFAVLAVDMSLIQLAKVQLQNAADAAALAGAVALAASAGDQSVATAEAIRIAGLNVAVQDMQRPVVITGSDVAFPGPDTITVTTHRTIGTNDPVTLYFLKVLGPENKGEVTARATATVSCISGTDCLRPFCPPDRWEDADNDSVWDPEEAFVDTNGNLAWDPGETFTDDNGNGVWDPAEFYDPLLTGYRAPDDIGIEVTLKLRNSNKLPLMGWYYAVRFGALNTGDPICEGGDCYREWIHLCEPYLVSIGDWLQLEKGVMEGPTDQGLEELITMDPTAEWDAATGTVINSAFPTSPRVIKVPAFDPTLGKQDDLGGPGYVTVTKFMVLFIEQHYGGDVVGRFMKTATAGVPDPGCSSGGFLYTVYLVE